MVFKTTLMPSTSIPQEFLVLILIWGAKTGLWMMPEPSSATEYDDPEEDDKLATLPPEQLTQVALQDDDPDVREKAVSYLEAYAHRDRRAFDALTRLAQHATHVEIQEFGAEALD